MKNIYIFLAEKKILLEEGFHLEWGARPIRRVIQSQIESEISIRFLDHRFSDSKSIISISGNEGQLIFKQFLKKNKSTNKKKNLSANLK